MNWKDLSKKLLNTDDIKRESNNILKTGKFTFKAKKEKDVKEESYQDSYDQLEELHDIDEKKEDVSQQRVIT